MIKVLQMPVTSANTEVLTAEYHTDTFEYLPEGKDIKYTPGHIMLSVRLDQSDETSAQIIKKQVYLRVCAAAARAFSALGKYEIKSISYPDKMEENLRRKCLIITILVKRNTSISDSELAEIEAVIETKLQHLTSRISTPVVSLNEVPAENKPTPDNAVTSLPDDVENEIFKVPPKKQAANYTIEDEVSEVTESKSKEDVKDTVASTHVISNRDTSEDSPSTPYPKADAIEDTKETENKSASNNETTVEEIKENTESNTGVDFPDSFTSYADLMTQLEKFDLDCIMTRREEIVIPEPEPEIIPENESILDQEMTDEDKALITMSISSREGHSRSSYADSFKANISATAHPGNILRPISSLSAPKSIPESQKDAYENASFDKPFLNSIEDYIPASNIEHLVEETPLYELHEDDFYEEKVSSEESFYENFTKVIEEMTGIEHLALERALKDPYLEDEIIEDVSRFMDQHCNIAEMDKPLLMRKIYNALFGYYVLKNAINDEDVSDIRILSYDNINVKVHGGHYRVSGLRFINTDDYRLFIDRLITRHGLSVNYPIVVFTDKEFHPDYILRFNLCLDPLNDTGTPYLHIRKVPKNKKSIDDLIREGMLDKKTKKYLLDKVQTSPGIIISGPSASGKTTLMNTLIDYIPKEHSIFCTQESSELYSRIHPNAYFQHIIKNDAGQIEIGLQETGTNGLLCDSQYFIIGEIKGAEARDMLRASNTGHKCWASTHSSSPRETISRLADYVKYGSDYTFEEAVRMLKDLEVIVYVEGYKIREIVEIQGYDDDKRRLIYKCIYRYDNSDLTIDKEYNSKGDVSVA